MLSWAAASSSGKPLIRAADTRERPSSSCSRSRTAGSAGGGNSGDARAHDSRGVQAAREGPLHARHFGSLPGRASRAVLLSGTGLRLCELSA
ncbi:hypothetical protein A4R44_02945 [Amycolatopsis sp. M39]|nr:hypothetical protein A4R44_02945 [Amycolatopsis sp. M39]